METTSYFRAMLERPDRKSILDQWIMFVVKNPVKEVIQSDGRIRRWAYISEMDNRALRVILLDDGITIHNAFFDRRFKEKQSSYESVYNRIGQ